MPDSARPKAKAAPTSTDSHMTLKKMEEYDNSAVKEHREQRAAQKASPSNPPIPRTPYQAASTAPVKNSVLHDLQDALASLLGPRVTAHAGKTVDQIVDEAVVGAKGANPDY